MKNCNEIKARSACGRPHADRSLREQGRTRVIALVTALLRQEIAETHDK